MLPNAISRQILLIKYFLFQYLLTSIFQGWTLTSDLLMIRMILADWALLLLFTSITCTCYPCFLKQNINVKDINLCKILIAYNSSREGGEGSHPACTCSKSTMETLKQSSKSV